MLDVASGAWRQVTHSSHEGVALDERVRPELVRFASHDGLELTGWLYRPRGESKPGPVVLSFHGGPESQELPAMRSDYQALLAKGTAVFAPNVRGSSGFGKKFVNLDNGALRVNAVKDIKACVDYLVGAKIAAPKRIGIMGGSYGGYMVMAGVTEYPNLFAAGANLFGVVNFATFFKHTEPWMAGPLQPLETPLLYFWSPVAKDVEVTISFPEGVVGQWYPEATTFAPKIDEMSAIKNGIMTWHVTMDPAIDPATFPPVEADEIWAPSRNVASTPVRWVSPAIPGYEEREQFIFYRDLGTFKPAVYVVAKPGGVLHVVNSSADAIEGVFVLRATAGAGAIVPVGAVAAGSEAIVKAPTSLVPTESYLQDARDALHKALVASGLYNDVAQAMVDTWSRSWFGNEGLRVLYLPPRAWADAWLPTSINPAPEVFVRTLVGRIEVLTPEEEQALVMDLQIHAQNREPMDPATLGRFAEPRILRAIEMLTDPSAIAYAKELLAKAHAMP